MQDTSIQWCDLVWNPTRGCSRVSPGCKHCYAEKIAARFSNPSSAFAGFAEFRIIGGKREAHWTGKVALLEDKLDEPLRRRKWALKFAQKHGRKPRCFVNSMSDLFHYDLPCEDIDQIFAVMALCQEIDFLILTKRGVRMAGYHDAGAAQRIAELAMLHRFTGSLDSNYEFDARDADLESWPLPNVRPRRFHRRPAALQ